MKRFHKEIVLGLAVGCVFMIGCEKKDRLSSSTSSFSINPPALTLVKGQSKTLTIQSSLGSTPTWVVSASSVGAVTPQFGTSVVFQSSSLGDVIVTATEGDRFATARVAVVTFEPGSSSYDVYTDLGLPNSQGENSDILDSSGILQTLSTGYTTEGVEYQRATVASRSESWGITVDKGGDGLSVDLSSFSGGTLKFSLRLGRVLSGEAFQVNVQDMTASRSVVLGSSHGLDDGVTGWQEISINISEFSGLDEKAIVVPFFISLSKLLAPLTYDVDAVRWESS